MLVGPINIYSLAHCHIASLISSSHNTSICLMQPGNALQGPPTRWVLNLSLEKFNVWHLKRLSLAITAILNVLWAQASRTQLCSQEGRETHCVDSFCFSRTRKRAAGLRCCKQQTLPLPAVVNTENSLNRFKKFCLFTLCSKSKQIQTKPVFLSAKLLSFPFVSDSCQSASESHIWPLCLTLQLRLMLMSFTCSFTLRVTWRNGVWGETHFECVLSLRAVLSFLRSRQSLSACDLISESLNNNRPSCLPPYWFLLF